MTDITKLSAVHLQVASADGDGMNLEICGESEEAKFAGGSLNPLVWFRADNEGEIQFVVPVANGFVSMPLEELQKAITAAKIEVHSESYYDA